MPRVLAVIKEREFHDAFAALPGYVTTDAGSVNSVTEFPRQRERNEHCRENGQGRKGLTAGEKT